MRSVLFLVAASCTVAGSEPERPAPLSALPPPAHVETDRFRDAEACAQCHLVDDTTAVLHDATNTNVSPVLLWRSSLMANAARDPYYLAVFSEELARAPERAAATEELCTRCHAPAASEEVADKGGHISFAELTAGTSDIGALARGGVTCTLCHQITAASLEADSGFSGGFEVGYQRKIFGPYSNPTTSPMMLIVNFEPAYGAHVTSSALCGSCHTVILPTASGEIVEQATYLEWRASEFVAKGQTCQSCHVPTVDHQGSVISTPVASTPATLAPRQPVGNHTFVGGNSYMLRLLADAVDWSGANVAASEFLAAADRDDEHLRGAAKLSVVAARREGESIVTTIRVENLTGHKLPTGYPSRRVWLHVTARAGDAVVFESGREPLSAQPHSDEITAPDQTQIWEAQLVDVTGTPTHRALDARRYSKDNRILPKGYNPTGADRLRTASVGVSNDASFVPGSDDITYRFAAPAGTTLDIELLYQAIRPEIVDAIEASATPAGSRFVDLARARPVTPVVMARTTAPAL